MFEMDDLFFFKNNKSHLSFYHFKIIYSLSLKATCKKGMFLSKLSSYYHSAKINTYVIFPLCSTDY